MYITATTVYYTPGPFGPLQHTGNRQVFTDMDSLRSAVRNADSILTRPGANHIVLDLDVSLAVQVSGYSGRRGMFVDLLPLSELQPFLT